MKDFRRWMVENAKTEFNIEPTKKGIGVEVEPRVSLKRVLERMDPEEGDAEDLARQFYESGGRVVEIDGHYIMVECAAGSFVIPKSCVRRKD